MRCGDRNNAQRGKPYSDRVRARFGASSGTGQRSGKRKCDFEFTRRWITVRPPRTRAAQRATGAREPSRAAGA
jgi:hypothetical protein